MYAQTTYVLSMSIELHYVDMFYHGRTDNDNAKQT